MLQPDELAWLRREFAASLPDLCTRQVRTLTRDSYGGDVETWTSTVNVPCRLVTAQSRQQIEGGQWVSVSGWRLSIRYDQSMSAGNRVVIGSDTFEVVAVEDSHSERISRHCDLRRLD